MRRHYIHFLKDIVEHCDKAQKFVKGLSFDGFIDDEKTYYATVRALEIIGEAINHIPDEIKQKYFEIPWHKIIGFRNMVIHEYFGIDKELVWNTANVNTIFLKEQISKILEDIGDYDD
jgi:uncharacterized protein with HEPN domain